MAHEGAAGPYDAPGYQAAAGSREIELYLARKVLHYGVQEWDALPYWHVAAYRKGLFEEFGRKDAAAPTTAPAPVSQMTAEGLAALEARGIQVIREG